MRRSFLGSFRSLRGRWLLVQIAGLVGILAVATWLVYAYSRSVILSEVNKGGMAAGNIVRNLLNANDGEVPLPLQELLFSMRAGVTGLNEIFVTDRNGVIIAHDNSARVGSAALEPDIQEALRTGFDSVTSHVDGADHDMHPAAGIGGEDHHGEHIRIVLPVEGKYDPQRRTANNGAVVLDVDADTAGERIRRGFMLLLFTLAPLIASFIGVQYLALHDGYRRLNALGKATAEFGRGNYDVRLPPGGPTEIQRLDEAFNAMAGQVQRQTEELRKARREAEDATHAKSRFLANVSHEIRTPLTGILGYAMLISEDHDLSKQTRHHVERVVKAANTLRVLIEDMLDVGKIEAGQVVIRQRLFAVRNLIEICLSVFQGAAQAKRIALEGRCHPAVPEWLVGDDDRIRQILLNLLSNAVKFTGSGSIIVEVTADGTTDGTATVRFQVKDTGIGIDKAKKDKLFQRFVQADDTISVRFGGTGLGLAISRDLVSLMGGEIGVESEPGKGSTFWFTLPLKIGEAPVQGPETAEEAGGPARRLRILVVDDNEMNRDLVRTILVRAGQSVEVAASGEHAIRRFENHRYDLILMDIAMPGIDGITATRRIRALEGGAHVAIAAMTANVMPDQVAIYRAAGMDDVLGKPIDPHQLLRVVARRGKEAASPAASEPEGGNLPVHDLAVLQSVRELLGAEKTHIFLRNLSNTLAGLDEAADPAARQVTARYAHSLVSISGQLGFARLSAAARALETACLTGDGVEEAIARFKAAGAEARKELVSMLAADAA